MNKSTSSTFKIGVFDSGVGGMSVANAIEKSISSAEVVFKNDPENLPYGTKTNEELLPLALEKLRELESVGCQLIVIACNTLSVTIIDDLRQQLSIPLIGVEPMLLEAASQTSTNIITICATPSTLRSERYSELKSYNPTLRYIEPDCSDWASMVEHNQVDVEKISTAIRNAVTQQSDIIVLGCTHYHWIEQLIKQVTEGKASVLQPEPIIINKIKETLAL